MAATETEDSSEHVTDFLRRIKELGEQRDQEDLERTRKLEEDILEARRQREERRRERARSLSPEKLSLSPSSRSIRAPWSPAHSHHDMNSPPSASQPAQALNDAMDNKPDLAVSHEKATIAAKTSLEEQIPKSYAQPTSPNKFVPLADTTLARSPTLSWQQRPTGPRTRPASFLDRRDNPLREPRTPQTPTSSGEPSRADIAKSLSSKDPNWFKQTPERGIGSAALRRGDADEIERTPSHKQQLHGLVNSQKQPETNGDVQASVALPASEIPSLLGSTQSKTVAMDVESSILSDSTQGALEERSFASSSTRSAAPDAANLDAETEQISSQRNGDSVQRSGLPTKGMGGFVQSAMLRRSDSINKRWNVPTGGTISRQNSISGVSSSRPESRDRNVPSALGMPRLDETNTFKQPISSGHVSRPGSAHSNSNDASKSFTESNSRPRSPDRGRAKTLSDPSAGTPSSAKSSEQTLQYSPSKRWSPQKSSWLESALSKPDTPKAKPAAPMQPAWLSDLQKNKQQRQSKDLSVSATSGAANPQVDMWGQPTKSSTKHWTPQSEKVTTAPSPKPKPSRLFDGSEATDKIEKTQEKMSEHKFDEHVGTEQSQPYQEADKTTEFRRPEVEPKGETDTPRDPNSFNRVSGVAKSVRPKFGDDAAPDKDFRSQLKSRPQTPAKPGGGSSEFLDAVGKLKRTETHKYVAPDVLGDNIRRGKAGLTITGGPQPSQRKDEFKESLIQQKERMKEKADSEPSGKPAVPKKPESPIPEALAKRQALGINDNTANVMSKPLIDNQQNALKKGSPQSPTKMSLETTSRSLSPPTVSAKFAGRFNPTIANVIARGPPPPSREGNSSPPQIRSVAIPKPGSAPSQERDGTSRPLEHKTKNRARGPKRRLPQSHKASEETALASASSHNNASPTPTSKDRPQIKSSSRHVPLNMDGRD